MIIDRIIIEHNQKHFILSIDHFILFAVKYYNPVTGMCLLRCSRDQYRQIWLAMTMLCQVQNRVCRCRMLHITGTMSKAVEYVRGVEQSILVSRSDSGGSSIPPNMMEIGMKKMQMLDLVQV